MNFSTRTAACFSAAASLLFASAAMGQALLTTSPYTDISAQTDISNYTYSAPDPLRQGTNRSAVTQIGNLNTANADMTATGGSYYGNTTMQTQIGNNNNSTINAVGNSNTLLATTQIGSGNTSSVSAYGDSNTLLTTQAGNGNNATIAAYGSNNSYSTTQIGTGLSVNLTQVGTGKSVSITQIGR